jgi:hypothetical protein
VCEPILDATVGDKPDHGDADVNSETKLVCVNYLGRFASIILAGKARGV